MHPYRTENNKQENSDLVSVETDDAEVLVYFLDENNKVVVGVQKFAGNASAYLNADGKEKLEKYPELGSKKAADWIMHRNIYLINANESEVWVPMHRVLKFEIKTIKCTIEVKVQRYT